MLLLYFLTAFCTSCTGFNLFGARRGAPCRAVTPCRTTLPPAQMSSTPNQHAESQRSAGLQDLQAESQRLSAALQDLRAASQRLSAALQSLRAHSVDYAAGAMQRQLSSWLQALQRFRIESSPTDEEVHSPPAKSKEAAPRDEPDAALPDQHVVARLEMALAAAGDSDEAEIDEVGREIEADLNFRDRMDTEANQLEEQGEFRAAELLRLRADALQDQITVKLEDVRASRPGKYSWEEDRWEEDSC